MALTEERLRTSSVSPAAERMSGKWRLTLAIAWLVLLPLAYALEPTPARGGATPWWAALAELALLGSLVVTGVGLKRGEQWAGGGSLIGASIFTAGVFACPATGHHAFGFWWFGELAASLVVLALSAVAYWRRPA